MLRKSLFCTEMCLVSGPPFYIHTLSPRFNSFLLLMSYTWHRKALQINGAEFLHSHSSTDVFTSHIHSPDISFSDALSWKYIWVNFG